MGDVGPESRGAVHRRRLRLALWIGLPLAVVAGAVIWWVDQGRHLVFPKNWGVVESGLVFRSGQIHPRLIEETLAEHDIHVVLDLAAHPPGHEQAAAERAATDRLGIRKVDLMGLGGHGTGDWKDYAVALQELVAARDAGTPVLVHCAGGSERTGGVFLLYRTLFQGWDVPTAWDEYLAYRDRPRENDELPRFLDAHVGAIVERLTSSGTLARPPDTLPTFLPAAEAVR